jgi:pimeloyl-ACP methyl ester carboxylesterase
MRGGIVTAAFALLALAVVSPSPGKVSQSFGRVHVWTVNYRAHDGAARHAYISLPAWYGPKNNPPIPLVISPHGRGVSARSNVTLWGALPAVGSFGVISPDGQGRKLARYSWGSAGQIDDLSRMPQIARLTLPWLRIDSKKVYAVGGSMGGQETLLLLAKHPQMLAGAAALDAVTNLAEQYRSFPKLSCDKQCRRTWKGPIGNSLQSLARIEIGGGPVKRRLAFAERSPETYARAIAFSCVPLELWWSTKDRIVTDQTRQSGALYNKLLELNPTAPVAAFVGTWRHSHEMHANTRLPAVVAWLGLIPPVKGATSGLHAFEPQETYGSSSCDETGIGPS